MLKKILIFLTAVFSLSFMFALTAGDIAILGVNTDATKSMVFVALEDIPAATTISFTDNAWNAITETWRTGEGTITWSTASALTKGTVVTITLGTTYTADVGSVTYDSMFNLAAAGDQILAYEGTTAPTSNTASNWLYGFSTESWTWANNSNTSDIPAALAGAHVGLTTSTTEYDNGYFANGSTAQTAVSVSGTKAQLLALFADRTLYYVNDTGPLAFPTYTVTVGAAGSPLIITSGTLNPFTAIIGTPSASQSYTLTGSNLTAVIVVTPPSGFAISANNTDFYTTAQNFAADYNGPVYVRLTGTTLGFYSGDITHTSAGATQVDIAVSGTVTNPVPTLYAVGTLTAFATQQGTPSAAQSYTLYGENLSGGIGVNPPSGFEVSTDGTTYVTYLSLASDFNGLVYVRMTGEDLGTFGGSIIHSSPGAVNLYVDAIGTVNPLVVPTLFMEENFAYTAGTLLMNNGWIRHSGTGTPFSPSVADVNLSYPGYVANSGLAGQTLGNGDDVHRNFTPQTSGTVYTAFLINVTSASEAGDYVYHFATNTDGTTDFKAKFFVGRDASNNLRFGLTKQSNLGAGVAWTGYDYALATTYLVVLKYQINAGLTNDVVTGWINPVIGATEPAPMLTTISTETDIGTLGIGSVAIRQSTTTPVAYFDGIRVSNDWAILWSGEEPPTPEITVTGEPVPLYNIAGLPSDEYTEYQLSGQNLTSPINIVAPEGFEVSTSTTSGWANTIQVPLSFNGTIYVRLVSAVVGPHSGDITHNSTGAAEATIRVEGETFAPAVTWNITANLTAFDHEAGTPSTVQSYTLSATNATADLAVSVAAPFELSETGTGNWVNLLTLPWNFNGSVYVRMNALTAGQYNADIEHNTTNASTGYLAVSGTASPPPGNYASDLFFSEYIEGSSNNKALEIFNGTGTPVDLSAYKVYLYSNGSPTPTNTLTFASGTILPHDDVYVIANASANATILAQADVTSTVTFFNGDDAVAIVKIVGETEEFVDIFGVIDQDPGTQWTATGGYSTLDKTLVRKPTVTGGVTVNPFNSGDGITTDFVTLGTEWDVYPADTATYLGWHTFTPGAQVAEAPVLNPAGGVYYSTVNVTMSTTTPGGIIYYTLDGSLPSDTNGFNYSVTGAPAVNATTNVKAITYAAGYTPSSVTSETYVFPTLVADIATLRAQATGTTIYRLTGEAVLTFQQATRHQKYIQDATAAIVIDDPAGIISTTYNLYDGITGITGTLGVYSGLLQFTPVVNAAPATSTGNVVVPEVRTLASLTSADQAKLVKVMNVTLDTTLGTYPATAANVNAADPSGTAILRTFPATDYSGTPIHDYPVNIVSLVGQFNADMQISPRFLADFEAYAGGLDVPIVQITLASGQIQLSWEAVTGATSYRVQHSDNPYSGYSDLTTTSNLSVIVSPGAMKFFRVYAVQ